MTMRSKYWFVILLLTSLIAVPARTQSDETYINDGTLRRIYTPILMYHYVGELPSDADELRMGLTVSPHQFYEHINYLRVTNHQSISMADLDEALRYGTPLPPNPIILTFDDGYIDHYVTVAPILNQFGFKGTFYVITSFADNNRAGYMNWQQIQDLQNQGMDIEPHTKNHADLSHRDYDFLVYEIMGSVESIEQHLGTTPVTLAYPMGRYDQTTLSFMETTYLSRTVTTMPGAYHTSDNYHEMTRLRITPETGVPGLAQILNVTRAQR
ncbi:MAG: polysaccharide deacetylase family protein [Anaerolineaceae bacterium]|nr:polysaccharide deacetylase family protein [Anaerolineaceae bacterium]